MAKVGKARRKTAPRGTAPRRKAAAAQGAAERGRQRALRQAAGGGDHGARHGALRALLAPQRALVRRAGARAALEAVRARQVGRRRLERRQLYPDAGHGHRFDPASRGHACAGWIIMPLGGACGIVALRRALRAVEAADAEVVACIGADTNHVDSFRQSLGSFSVFARDAVLPYGCRRPERELRLPDLLLHAHLRRDTRGFRQALRRAARQCARLSARSVQEEADASRSI